MQNYVIYICYGSDNFYHEAAYSILSLIKHNPHPDFKVVVALDNKQKLLNILGTNTPDCLNLLEFDENDFALFRGAGNYVYRIKPKILEYFCTKYLQEKSCVLFLDTDTLVTKNIVPLFADIVRGIWIMNDCEGIVLQARYGKTDDRKLYQFFNANRLHIQNQQFNLDTKTILWNSGVIGFLSDRAGFFTRSVQWMDEAIQQLPFRTMEQIALSVLLWTEREPVTHSGDYIYHYHFFREFSFDLKKFFEVHREKSFEEKMDAVLSIDPRVRAQPKLKFMKRSKPVRSLKRRMGVTWKPLPYPWDTGS